MRIHRKLTITLSGITIGEWIALLEQLAPIGWKRDTQWEHDHKPAPPTPLHTFCFLIEGQESYLPAYLFLNEVATDTLAVSNIVSLSLRNLSVEKYNSILERFHFVVELALVKVGNKVTVEFAPDQAMLEDIIPADLAERFRQFVRSVNARSPFAAGDARRRWMELLAECHQRKCDLAPDLLAHWLQDDEYWPDYAANDLAQEFEFARQLLRTYDRKQAS